MNNDSFQAEMDPVTLAAYEQLADRFVTVAPDKAENAYLDRPAVLDLLGDVQGQCILDVGCGPGLYAETLVAHGATVLGLDASPRMIQFAQARVPVGAMFRVDTIERPLTWVADESVDGIVAALVLDHVADWTGPFREFARVLRTNGRCVFSVEHPVWTFQKYKPVEYFRTKACEVQFRLGGEAVTARQYLRPLGAYLMPVLAAGLHVDAVMDVEPGPACAERWPEAYEKYRMRPTFLAIRVRKP